MTTRFVFNGSVLIRPGGATKVDASKFNVAPLAGVGTVALIGNADGGAPRAVTSHTSPKSVRDLYRSGDLVDAASILASPGNDVRIPGGPTRILCYKVNLSTRSSYTMQRTVAVDGPALHQLANAAPYTVSPGDVFNWSDDLGGPYNTTFAGTAATHTAAGVPAVPMAAETLILAVNGGPSFTITFGVEASLAAIITLINGVLHGAYAVDNAGSLQLISSQYGTGSKIVISALSTALVKLQLTAATYSGTGDADDLSAMTAAEFKAAMEVGGNIAVDITTTPPTLESITSGVAGQLTIAASVPADLNTRLGATAGVYNGTVSSLADAIILYSKDYGAHVNTIGAAFTTPTGSDRKLVITWAIDGEVKTETSPTIANQAKFSIQYIGAGATCVMSTLVDRLTTTVGGGPGGEDLALMYADYDNVYDLVAAINAAAGGVYSAVLLISNGLSYDPANLDFVTAVDVKAAAYSAMSRCYDVVEWVNDNSDICTAVRQSTGATVPDVWAGTKYLAGGTKGTSDNTAWNTTATLALSVYRASQIVPLVSEDPAAAVGTYTFTAVAAAYSAHACLMSSTGGRNERQAWIGMKGNKAALIAQSRSLNTEHVIFCADRLFLPAGKSGNITELAEWSAAVALAGMRAGAEIGEPLTWKYVRTFGIAQDYDPTADGEIEDLLLAGVTLITEDLQTGGYKCEKCITTYTKSENNAYTEESIVQVWKAVSYDLRTSMELQFTGTKGNPAKRSTMIGFADSKLRQYGPSERGGNDALADSVYDDGSTAPAHRDLDVTIGVSPDPSDVARLSVIISPVSGINFQLQTIFVVPAQIA